MKNESALNPSQIEILSNVYLVLLTPSVFGSSLVLLVSLVRRRQLREQVHLLVQLALADLLAALILMFTSVTNKFTFSQSGTICGFSLPLSLTFFFISFLLVVVYANKARNIMLGWRTRPAEEEGSQVIAVPLHVFVWLAPILMYIAYVLTIYFTYWQTWIPDEPLVGLRDGANDTQVCSCKCILFLHVPKHPCSDDEQNHDTLIRILLFVAIIIVITSCSVIYHKVGKLYKTYEQRENCLFPPETDSRSRRRIKRAIATARNMVLVIIICWTPTLLLILLSALSLVINVTQQVLFAFYLVQAASLSLQGLFNSIVYAWRRPNFTEAVLGENTPLLNQGHAAFFEESLGSCT